LISSKVALSKQQLDQQLFKEKKDYESQLEFLQVTL
jgi:hypothetical protein